MNPHITDPNSGGRRREEGGQRSQRPNTSPSQALGQAVAQVGLTTALLAPCSVGDAGEEAGGSNAKYSAF